MIAKKDVYACNNLHCSCGGEGVIHLKLLECKKKELKKIFLKRYNRIFACDVNDVIDKHFKVEGEK